MAPPRRRRFGLWNADFWNVPYGVFDDGPTGEPKVVQTGSGNWSKNGISSQALRLFPEGSPGYNMLFPKRNDIESTQRHLKDLMFNDRVLTIGDRNLRIWLHTYQTRVNRTALIAWHYRTGGDISEWFGEWKPPPQRKPLAA